jgi:hypothetical protein
VLLISSVYHVLSVGEYKDRFRRVRGREKLQFQSDIKTCFQSECEQEKRPKKKGENHIFSRMSDVDAKIAVRNKTTVKSPDECQKNVVRLISSISMVNLQLKFGRE